MMTSGLGLSLGALLTLLPAALVRWRRNDARDRLLYAMLALGAAGPCALVASQAGGAWHTDFATSLWLVVAATMALFLALALATRQAWRLTPLLVPLMLGLGLLATLCQYAPGRPVPDAVPAGWLDAHIVFAAVTYGLLTIAAVAGLAVLLQERALKGKHPTMLTRLLPAVAESERLEVRLLAASEAVLALGLASGMAAAHFLGGRLLPFDHKIVLSVAAFVVIGAVLLARRVSGIRGRRVARFALAAFLLLLLAGPGVKFVTDVLMG
jgi:ABC-type uncharacterized transport system permease subunit